jgi:Flp pilus assembly protein TadG
MQPLKRSFLKATTRAVRAFARFAKTDDGVTAVEFALVAAPFFGLMFAILETALIFFGQQTLETAVSNAAREIRTGQAQQQGFSQAQFKDQICQQIQVFFDCTGGLALDVRTYKTFDTINLTTPIDATGKFDPSKFTYDPGHGTDIITVRAFYEWPTWSRLLGLSLNNLADGNHMLAAAAAFRNEPFPW